MLSSAFGAGIGDGGLGIEDWGSEMGDRVHLTHLTHLIHLTHLTHLTHLIHRRVMHNS